MEYEKKFGNIDLYLWQIRKVMSDSMRKESDFIGHLNYFRESDYYCKAYKLMVTFMLRRFSMPGTTPIVDTESIIDVLHDRGMAFEVSDSWYANRNSSSIQMSGLRHSIMTAPDTRFPLVLTESGESHNFYRRLAHISGSDLVDIIILMEDLVPRLHAIVHEEYQGRRSRAAANRIRRIAARHRRR